MFSPSGLKFTKCPHEQLLCYHLVLQLQFFLHGSMWGFFLLLMYFLQVYTQKLDWFRVLLGIPEWTAESLSVYHLILLILNP